MKDQTEREIDEIISQGESLHQTDAQLKELSVCVCVCVIGSFFCAYAKQGSLYYTANCAKIKV